MYKDTGPGDGQNVGFWSFGNEIRLTGNLGTRRVQRDLEISKSPAHLIAKSTGTLPTFGLP